jgi:hypothetical protein
MLVAMLIVMLSCFRPNCNSSLSILGNIILHMGRSKRWGKRESSGTKEEKGSTEVVNPRVEVGDCYKKILTREEIALCNWMDYDLEEMCFLKFIEVPEWFKLMEEAKIDATKKKVLEVILAEEDGDNVAPSSSAEKESEELSDLESATDDA